MSHLRTRQELARLAALLTVSVDELQHLRGLSPDDLATLRRGIAEQLFERHRRTFKKIGALAGAVPAALAGKIAQSALGPVVSARAAATMEPAVAVKLAGSLPATFLADLSVQLDPVRARPIIAGLPEKQVLEVSGLLLERREHMAMSRFLPVISTDTALRAIAPAEHRAVLEIANLAEDDAAIEQILEQMPQSDDEQLAAAVTEEEVALDALSLAARVSPTNGVRVLRAGLGNEQVCQQVGAAVEKYGLEAEIREPLSLLAASERAALLG